MKNIWTQGLNPEQEKAVQHDFGPLLILAGAGSGKTTVLVSRTGRIIADKVAKSDEICVLTFTNKSARELKHRVSKKLAGKGRDIWAGTFHSFGLQILRRFHAKAGLNQSFGIVDQSDCSAILKELLKDIKVAGKDKFDADKLLNLVNEIRTGDAVKHKATDEYDELAEVLTPKFNKKLELLGVVDFEALLLRPLQLFKEHPECLERVQADFTQVMVDEFQDTNKLQMSLIHLLVKPHQNITVVGDDDQSIYGWRGAQVSNILNFPHDFANCEVIKLERNYRSTPSILNLANEVIAKNKDRHGKVLRSDISGEVGDLPEVFVLEKEEDEADFIVTEIQHFQRQGLKHKDMAILYRSNTQGGLIESSLRRANIDYTISGGTSIFDRKEVKDVMAYIKQSMTPNEVSLRRILNVPPRGIGESSVERLIAFAIEKKLTFHEALAKHLEIPDLNDKAREGMGELLQFSKDLPHILVDSDLPGTPGSRLIEQMQKIGYRQYVFQSAADSMGGEKKWQVVEILGRILDSYMMKRSVDLMVLKDFLDAMMLRDDGSEQSDDSDKVQLMTLHASKGLEFPFVVLAGIEEDLLPHKKLGGDIDEERRLFYVGITRAKQHLVLSRCLSRKKHGVVRKVAPSRFLIEIDPKLYREYNTGFRPVSGAARDDLVSNFLAGLQSKIETSGPKGRI